MTTPQVLLTPFFLDTPVPEAARLMARGWRVNTPDLPEGALEARLAAVHAPLADLVAEAARDGRMPVSIAGDCCATIAVLAGLQRAGLEPVLVWLDAHGDFNTAETTPSGFLGGMPLAMIVGLGAQDLVRAAGLRPLPAGDVFLADARDLDPGERALLDGSGVRRFADLPALLAALPADRPLYVHLDPDVMRPDDAPAMHYATPGGPTFEAVRAAARRLHATGRLAAASLTLWDFPNDPDHQTERACLTAFGTLIGAY